MGLKELRKALGYTQQETADRIGVSRKTYWNYENAKTRTPALVIKELKRELKERARS